MKFAPEPRAQKSGQHNQYYNNGHQPYQLNGMDPYMNGTALQRSKSLSSADALTRGMAGLGLGLGNEVADIGQFTPEIQQLIETALEDPNKLNSRCLMELTSQFIKRAVESRRFALPISRLCLNIIAKEQKETFLEALLNTCRQWYQEREKVRKPILSYITTATSFALLCPTATVCHSRNEVAIAGSFYGFHGISYGNVLPVETPPAPVAYPQRGNAATFSVAQFALQVLRGLCASPSAFAFRGKYNNS